MSEKKTYISLSIAVATLVIVALVGLFAAMVVGPADNDNQPIPPRPSDPNAGANQFPAAKEIDGIMTVNITDITTDIFSYYVYPQENLSIGYPNTWEITPIDKVKSPKYFSGLKFALRKKGTQCILGYYITPHNSHDNYQQVSFGDRVFTREAQFDSSWYALKSQLPENFAFKQIGRQDFPNQIRASFDARRIHSSAEQLNVFVLFNEDGSYVNDVCNYEASVILATITTKFDKATITESSKGDLLVTSARSHSTPRNILSFIDDADQITKEVSLYRGSYAPTPVVYKNLIFLTEGGVLKTLNVFTGTTRLVPGITLGSSEVVNEFYIYNDRLFYLAGKTCTDYMNKCDNKLYEYDMRSGVSQFHVGGVISRNIVGYEPKRNELHLYISEGDAGCMWMSTEIYKFDTRELKRGEKYSACVEEENFDEVSKATKEYFASFSDQYSMVRTLRVENGKLQLPRTLDSFGAVSFRYILQK